MIVPQPQSTKQAQRPILRAHLSAKLETDLRRRLLQHIQEGQALKSDLRFRINALLDQGAGFYTDETRPELSVLFPAFRVLATALLRARQARPAAGGFAEDGSAAAAQAAMTYLLDVLGAAKAVFHHRKAVQKERATKKAGYAARHAKHAAGKSRLTPTATPQRIEA
ncbi:MAG: hypothetical protein ACLQME_13700 [Alphaproteobacteria bacterium]